MLDYIKQKLAERQQEMAQESTKVDPANVSAEMLMEYAPIMKGLEDLSIEGTEDPSEARSLVNIPLAADDEDVPDSIEDAIANDPEIGKIEMDAATGTITDTPIDANIQTEYAEMKTMNDFIQESYSSIDFDLGMSVDEYDAKVMGDAKEKFIGYRNEVLQEQSFGFTKMPINSESVESAVLVEFAENKSALLEPNYQVDENGNIRKKQLDTMKVLMEGEVFNKLTEHVTRVLQEQYGELPEGKSIWSFIQPVSINVPIDPIDKFSAIIGFKNMLNFGNTEYVRCSVPVLESYRTTEFVPVPADRITQMNEVSCTKTMAIQESANENPQYQKVVQEAIDFGGADANTVPEVKAPDTTNAAPPSMDESAPATENPAPATDNNGKVSIPVETNDVSDQIAEKVATDTSVPTESQNPDQAVASIDSSIPEPAVPAEENAPTDVPTDAPAPSVENVDSTNELEGDTGAGSSDIESQLNELDNIGSEANADGMDQSALGAEPSADINNMSMDEMMQAASDKLKSMPINAIQKFLSGDETALQESVFPSKSPESNK